MSEFTGNGDQTVRNGTSTVRFGDFEADLNSGEVRKSGSRIKLQEQPFKVLQILLEHPGSLVTRDELQSRIWPAENFGDFDHAVNVAVGKLRTALGDTADNPTFIETVPRRGYRFVAKLDEAAVAPEAPVIARPVLTGPATVPGTASATPTRRRGLFVSLAMAAALLVLAVGLFLGRNTAHLKAPEFQRLTVRHGTIYAARFAPDGRNVVYSASWDGAPIEMFSTDSKSSGTRRLDLPATQLLAVSSTNQMAVLQAADPTFMLTVRGTLGQVPLSGGSPRSIAERIEYADWSADGKSLAVVQDVAGRRRLEFPIGHVLYETMGWISHPRISPAGDTIAFLDHPSFEDDQGMVSIVDLAGHKRVLSTGWESEEGLAWSPEGKEIWFSATQAGLDRRIYAVDLAGRQRLAYQALGGVTLQDISGDGSVLLTRDENRAGMVGMAPGAKEEVDLSWLDWSLPVDLSSDGNTLIFDEEGEQSGPTYTVALRNMQGAAPIPLGEGMAGDLSPDGKWAAAVVSYSQIILLPTGAGSAKRIERYGMQMYGHQIHWTPDGKQIVFAGIMPGQARRCFQQSIDGGKPRPLTPEGFSGCGVSPDGQTILASDLAGGPARLFPKDGGAPRAIAGLLPGESTEWSSDPNVVYVYQMRKLPTRLYRLNVLTGERTLFKELHPIDTTGLCDMTHVLLSKDGRAYVYSYTRMLSDLYLVKGLK